MKRIVLIFSLFFSFYLLNPDTSSAQCSICTKTAQQLGEKPAKGLNTGIIYLAFAPYVIILYIAYRWKKKNRQQAMEN